MRSNIFTLAIGTKLSERFWRGHYSLVALLAAEEQRRAAGKVNNRGEGGIKGFGTGGVRPAGRP